jgi:hypothetical protein
VETKINDDGMRYAWKIRETKGDRHFPSTCANVIEFLKNALHLKVHPDRPLGGGGMTSPINKTLLLLVG